MKRFEIFVFALLIFWPIDVLHASTEAIVNHPEFQTALRVLDTWVEETVRQREQPGLSIGVVYDQNLVWSKGYGFADLAAQLAAALAGVDLPVRCRRTGRGRPAEAVDAPAGCSTYIYITKYAQVSRTAGC